MKLMCERYSKNSCTRTQGGAGAARAQKEFSKWHSACCTGSGWSVWCLSSCVVAWEANDGRFALRTRKLSVRPACNTASHHGPSGASMRVHELSRGSRG